MEEHHTLAAQTHSMHHDKQEEAHFQQVCESYQQYATFHQTVQQGVNARLRLMESSRSIAYGNGESVTANAPTVASILPPSLLSGCIENQMQNEEFCDATIRNQFFLDSVLRYSGGSVCWCFFSIIKWKLSFAFNLDL
jgi:hypothetical protein